MKAILYSGPGCIWCERVKVLLTDNGYEVDERPVQYNVEALFTLNNNEHIRSIPQVVIETENSAHQITKELIGGYTEVKRMIVSTNI